MNYSEAEPEIVIGGLYEVWLSRKWSAARLAVPIRRLVLEGWNVSMWEVMIEGEIRRVAGHSICPVGLATCPSYPVSWNIKSADIMIAQPMTAHTTMQSKG